MDLNNAIRKFRFFDTYREMPKTEINFAEKEWIDSQKIILFYLRLLEQDKLLKLCKECQKPKPLIEFGLTTEDKLRASCRVCYADYQAKYTVANYEAIKSQNLNREIRIVNEIAAKKIEKKLEQRNKLK